MTAEPIAPAERARWSAAAGLALAVHVAAGSLVLGWGPASEPPVPEPVVLIELPPETAPAPAVAASQDLARPQPDHVPPQAVTPPIEVPPVRAPMPQDPVTLPSPAPPPPVRQAAPAPAAPAAAGPVAAAPGSDPRARAQEADYFSLISAHLNRKKRYPAEAKKAMQQGIVTVRFTVDREGNVSGVAIKRTSGHALLDQATIELVQRVAPLPRMPASMKRDTITLSLPIDYSLKTS